jgi:hypothetical protein
MKTLIVFLALCGVADAGSPYVRTQVGVTYWGGPAYYNGYGYNNGYGYGHYHGPQYVVPFPLPYFVPPDPIYIPPPREGSYLDRQAKARAAKQNMPVQAPASRAVTLAPSTISAATPYDAFMRQAREAFLGGDYPAAMTAAKHAQLENDTPDARRLIAAIQGMAQ